MITLHVVKSHAEFIAGTTIVLRATIKARPAADVSLGIMFSSLNVFI